MGREKAGSRYPFPFATTYLEKMQDGEGSFAALWLRSQSLPVALCRHAEWGDHETNTGKQRICGATTAFCKRTWAWNAFRLLPGRCRCNGNVSQNILSSPFSLTSWSGKGRSMVGHMGEPHAHIPHDGEERWDGDFLQRRSRRLKDACREAVRRNREGPGESLPRRVWNGIPVLFPSLGTCRHKKAGWMPAFGICVFRKVRLRWRGARPDSGRRGFSWWLSSQFRRYSTYRDCVRSFRFW